LSGHYKYYYRKRYFPKLLNDDSFQNRGRD
jgi:hypothetical protein